MTTPNTLDAILAAESVPAQPVPIPAVESARLTTAQILSTYVLMGQQIGMAHQIHTSLLEVNPREMTAALDRLIDAARAIQNYGTKLKGANR